MNKTHVQMAALGALTFLAAGLLVLTAYLFGRATSQMTPDGKIPILDAGMFSACLLSFQQALTAMRSIWESQERAGLIEGLSNSVPGTKPNPPSDDAR